MGLERVIDEIRSAGEEQSRKIRAEAEEERKKIVTAARVEAEKAKKKLEAETEQRISLQKQQALSSAELEAKKRVLKEQNVLLSQVKEEVLRELAAKDSGEMRAQLDKLAKVAAKRLSKGVIHCRKEDENLILAPLGFKKVADLKASGGIIAESEDGSYRIDLTFEALLEDVWGKNVRQIFDILFGGGA